MEADDLKAMIRQCPLRIVLNSGEKFLVEKPEFILVGTYQASILVPINGALRTVVIGLMNISSVHPLGEVAETQID